MSDAEDRTLPATPRRRLVARREGMIPPAALPAWGASVAVTILLFPAWWRSTSASAVSLLEAASVPDAPLDAWASIPLVLPTVALTLAAAAAALGVRSVVDGAGFSPGRVFPDPRRVSVLAGVRRIFSGATLGAALANALWLALPAAVAARSAAALFDLVARTLDTPAGATAGGAVADGGTLVAEAFALLLPTLVATLAVAVGRWGWLRRGAERRIRMTPEELREELRDQGPPAGRRHGRTGTGAAVASGPVGQVVAGGA